MRKAIEGIGFDLDGTLYPNYRLNTRLIPFILKEWRLISAFGRARHIIRKNQKNAPLPKGDFYEYQAEIASKLLSIPKEELKEKFDSLIYKGWEPFFKQIKLFKGVIDTLKKLKEAGYKLGLLSDFPPETKLEYLGLNGFWDSVLCSERYGAIKPHPLSFNELASGMGLEPQRILYVGNSRPYDVAGAKAAGMKTAWIKPPLFIGNGHKSPKPDFSFTDYRKLFNFVINYKE